MVLNPRVEPWIQVSDAEHRGINPHYSWIFVAKRKNINRIGKPQQFFTKRIVAQF